RSASDLRLSLHDALPIFYGPRPANWSAVEHLFHAVREKDVVDVGSLATARRFIHVADIASGILSVVGMGNAGYLVFNLSGDRLIDRKSTRLNSSHQIISY